MPDSQERLSVLTSRISGSSAHCRGADSSCHGPPRHQKKRGQQNPVPHVSGNLRSRLSDCQWNCAVLADRLQVKQFVDCMTLDSPLHAGGARIKVRGRSIALRFRKLCKRCSVPIPSPPPLPFDKGRGDRGHASRGEVESSPNANNTNLCALDSRCLTPYERMPRAYHVVRSAITEVLPRFNW
jgi:hypothetical protein